MPLYRYATRLPIVVTQVTNLSLALIAAGLAAGVVALLALHLLPTGLSPVRNVVSQYGISRYRTGYRVQTLAYALAGVGATVGVAGLPKPNRLTIALCAVFAAARAAISWFPMDEPGTPLTASGRRHGLLAILAFLGLALAAGQLSRTLGRDHLDPTVAGVSAALSVLMIAALVGMTVDRRGFGSRYIGLIERVFYLGMTAWLATVAVLVATR